MATTAKAKAGTGKGTATSPKPPPKRQNKRTALITTASPQGQADLLATALQAHPGMSALEYARLHRIAPDDVLRMRGFVFEYLKDYNLKNAALRMGYPEFAASDAGRLFLHHSFVQLRLFEVMEAMEAEKIVSSSQVISALWEEARRPDTIRDGCVLSSSSTRISALSQLVKIKGLTAPKGNTPTATPNGGIMMVPFYVAPDDWESHARQTQQALKKDVCLDAEIVA